MHLLVRSLCEHLTVSLPAVSSDGEGGDSVPGDSGGGWRDLHLDTAGALLVALQCRAMQGRLDGITHLRARMSTISVKILILLLHSSNLD